MTGFSAVVRRLIAERAKDFNSSWPVCEVMAVCQGRKAEAAHHRRPRGAGGSRREDTNLPANSLAVCTDDHIWIESHREEALRFGWLVLQAQTPADIPVLRRGVWVLLDNAGGFERVATPTQEAG